jgi:hypothetical protein
MIHTKTSVGVYGLHTAVAARSDGMQMGDRNEQSFATKIVRIECGVIVILAAIVVPVS